MTVAVLGNARWMEEVKPIQSFLRERERLLFSLHGDAEIQVPVLSFSHIHIEYFYVLYPVWARLYPHFYFWSCSLEKLS